MTMSIDIPSLLGNANELTATAVRFGQAQDATSMTCPRRFPSEIAETVDATQLRVAGAGQRLATDARRTARDLESETLWVVAVDNNMANPLARFMLSRWSGGISRLIAG